MLDTRLARLTDLAELADLFDQYRIFYGQKSDLAAATEFIGQRLQAQDSVLIVAQSESKLVGFSQLYPSYSSVSLCRIYILNDLFVAEACRGKGAGKALLNAARVHVGDRAALRLQLATRRNNAQARALYEKTGWIEDQEFVHYSLVLEGGD